MAWYNIVLIVIGIHFLLLILLIILLSCNVNEDKLRLVFFPILHFRFKKQEAIRESERRANEEIWRAERKKEEELLVKYQYPKLNAIRLKKSVIENIEYDNAPPNSIPLSHNIYQMPDGSKVYCSKPFQVIYFESNYSKEINQYISSHYDEIIDKLGQYELSFIYIPRLVSDLQESVHYNYPDSPQIPLGTFTAEDFYKELSDGIAKKPNDNPMLIIPDPVRNAGYPPDDLQGIYVGCHAYLLNYTNEEQFDFVFRHHLDNIINEYAPRYSREKLSEKKNDTADVSSISTLAEEIQSRINQLYAMGVSEYVISKIVSLPKPQLSHLLITEDFRIILTDYNNMEIAMPSLSKVLFFFYLNHPDGVLFKELRDHKAELFEIYRTISPLEDMDKMEKSINDIIDSTKNSVNEKCSRVRAAFVSQFNDNLAQNYYITGYAGNPKKIELDRTLITDKSGLLKLNME